MIRLRGREHAYRVGQSHAAYQWGKLPWGDWTAEEIEAYHRGYAGEELEKPHQSKTGGIAGTAT